MKNFFTIFFAVLGAILFVALIIGAWFYFTGSTGSSPFGGGNAESGSESTDKHPYMSESQEKALESFGIDPADVPSEITAEQEACFEAELGAERVAEIKAGATPTMPEYFKTKDCF